MEESRNVCRTHRPLKSTEYALVFDVIYMNITQKSVFQGA